ncbi:MAG TPA: type II toxin-antitoxin system PemK/MazF family toxin [Elusimicrobiota bacterium]|nr:type II toxin-antitoxin system PemK/MazF family toxin [Elusimicrobiota bacterium]
MIRRGELYWIDFRGSVGAEIRKVRPAVVISADDHTEHMGTVTVVPFSSRTGGVRRYEVAVPAGVVGDGRPSRLKTHQLRAVDKSRIGGRLGLLPAALMPALERSLRRHLGVEEHEAVRLVIE